MMLLVTPTVMKMKTMRMMGVKDVWLFGFHRRSVECQERCYL
jgi:hypothetical protein